MKYLVVILKDVNVDGTENVVKEVAHILACHTTREVAAAIRSGSKDDWSVWEVTPQGIVQRAASTMWNSPSCTAGTGRSPSFT